MQNYEEQPFDRPTEWEWTSWQNKQSERTNVGSWVLWGRCQYKQNRFVKFLNSKRKHVILQGECLSSCLEFSLCDTYLRKNRCCDDWRKKRERKKHTQRERESVNLGIKTRITAEMIRNQMTRFYPKMNVLDGNTFLTLACRCCRRHWEQYTFDGRCFFRTEFEFCFLEMNGFWHMKRAILELMNSNTNVFSLSWVYLSRANIWTIKTVSHFHFNMNIKWKRQIKEYSKYR